VTGHMRTWPGRGGDGGDPDGDCAARIRRCWIFCGGRCCGRKIRKSGIIKNYMSGYYNSTRLKIKAPVPLVLTWVTKEHTPSGTWREFMGGGGI
jgi:hypothetical protein